MSSSDINALSPLDGRYQSKVEDLRPLCSEFGLIHLRVLVEVRWLQFLANRAEMRDFPQISPVLDNVLNQIVDEFAGEDARRVKEIEATTNHDVKAVEYFLAEKLGEDDEAKRLRPFLHFACTSEDINNLSYALMLDRVRSQVLVPAYRELIGRLRTMAGESAELAMLARTHGQAASPTTLGKELANVVWRLKRQLDGLSRVEILGKINGAVGNFNAHTVAYPDVDWPEVSRQFVESLGLSWNPYTTQIEPHDWMAEFCHALVRVNTVLLDASRDFWAYIALGYFRQRRITSEVGSSTMPHKVNPIDFENAEGNLGLANAFLEHFAAKLPISRWQRDLSDSTVQRNIGVAFGHSLIAVRSLHKGLDKLEPDEDRIRIDLETHWEVIAEAIQTVMRRHGHADAYEQLKALTRGKPMDAETLTLFIEQVEIPDEAKALLSNLSPADYTGLASELVRQLDTLCDPD